MKKLFYLCIAMVVITLSSTRAKAQTISTHSESLDSVCGLTIFNVTTAGCAAGQTLTIFYGDATSNSAAVACSTSVGSHSFYHAYAASGSYTVKIVLNDGTVNVDSVTYSFAVSYCRQLPIFAYLDVNGNCTKDAGEPDIYTPMLIAVDSAGTPIDTVSMSSGMWYTSYGMAGTVYGFTLITAPAGLSIGCPSTGVIYSTVPSGTFVAAPEYYAFQCSSSSSFDLAISATFRPALAGGGANKANVMVSNSNCTGTDATVKFEYSPKYTFGSIYPSTLAYTVSGTSVTVSVGTVTPTSPKNFTVSLTPVVTLMLGDTVNTKFTVSPTTGDVNPANNVVVRCDTVRSSYDPNAKSVTPSGYITAGTRLEYMLEFENDGNDTAYNIHIMDTLSDYLDINTLQMGVSSHKVNLIRYVDASRNILKFDFPNIYLPDSVHHDYCRGMVTFSIKAKSTLALGTVIANRVGIYFDANPVVMTNTAYSKIPLPTGVTTLGRVSQVELYPNPVSEELTVNTEVGAYSTLTIYNVMGQNIGSQDISNANTKVNVHSLVPGIYYVTLKGINGSKSIKFEKK